MKFRMFVFWVVSLILFSQSIEAQKVLLLEKPGTTKRYLYKTGDKISVRLGEPEFAVYGDITYLDDSVCTINKDYTFQLAKVKEVTRTRHFLNANWRKWFLVPVVYTGGSIINRSIHKEKPLIDNTIPIVAGSAIALGTASLLLRYSRHKMKDGWHLKVLDFDIFNEKTGTQE